MKNLRKAIKMAGVFCLLAFAVLFYLSHPYIGVDRKEKSYKERWNDAISALQNDLSVRYVRDVSRNGISGDDITGKSQPSFALSKLCLTCNSYSPVENDREYDFFNGKYTLDKEPFASWVQLQNKKTYCDNRVHVFNDLFAILHNVTLFPTRRIDRETQPKGGEEIRNVLNQADSKEDYKFDYGYLEMICKADAGTEFRSSIIRALRSLRLTSSESKESPNKFDEFFGKYAIAIRRQDYANLHNWVRNTYNTFVLMMHFRIQPKDVRIIFMDGHPRTELDNAWTVLYNQPIHVGHIEQTVKFQNLILGLEENKGPITEFRRNQVPYLEEFRSFILSRFILDPSKELNCSNPRISVILRRNAVYHPRNVAGNVGRKIFNEAELMNDLMTAFPNACVKSVLMESLPMRSQLDFIRNTDIFIGMHGAGMSHATFLPKHAGILELFAKNFKVGRPWFLCYQKIAQWRNLHYDSWENFDQSLEMPSDFTVLPTKVIVDKVRGLMNKMCPR